MSILSTLPPTVKKMCSQGAWIVGGAALNPHEANDIDIMVPWTLWPQLAILIPKQAAPTFLGGWRWIECNVCIDVWPDTLDRTASSGMFKAAWHPLSGHLLQIIESEQ